MAYIAHVAIVDDWESAERLGEYEVSTRGVSLAEAGFISAVAVTGIQRLLGEKYGDIRYDLLLIVLDSDALVVDGSEVVEPSSGRFRILGPIQTSGDAVVAVLPIARVDDCFVSPELGRFGKVAARE